jgi:tetratricopeptide (TPR) repeat protein
MKSYEELENLTAAARDIYEKKDYRQAAQLFQEIAHEWKGLGDALMAAEMMNNVSVALLQAGDADGALQAIAGTDRVFREAGDEHREALSIGNQGSAYEELGQFKEAEDCYLRSADLFAKTGHKEERSYVLKRLSAVQVRTGSHLQSLASMDAALSSQPKLTAQEKWLAKLLKIPFKLLKK